MTSYYREHVSYPNVTPSSTLFADAGPNEVPEGASPIRQCSVRGCGAVLSPNYELKMCEGCRGRHRVYATTKRAKRKMEKALLGAQNGAPVVWMPPDDAGEEEEPESVSAPSPTRPRVSRTFEPATPVDGEQSPHFTFSQAPWDPSSIDPRLFSQTSELAGALTLPTPPPPADLPARSSSASASVSTQSYPPTATLEPAPQRSLSATSLSEAAMKMDGPLPPRFCSIKGCKALVSGSSFFKMCEPCRNRYRNYGTTKRAKWKREKEVAVAELQKLRSEQDKQRADLGLPPLSQQQAEWHEYQANGAAPTPSTSSQMAQENAPLPPRMCTVSHCREILPGDYQYLRCERHRIQNRHHSKLKRVRDKEVKAQAFDGWAAAVTARTDAVEPGGDETDSREQTPATGRAVSTEQSQLQDVDDVLDMPCGEMGTGIPPAARGTRRTNHVCSIKACYNLLSPENPWKMCDLCRQRDRAGRKMKALRDSGVITESAPFKAVEGGAAEGGTSADQPEIIVSESSAVADTGLQSVSAEYPIVQSGTLSSSIAPGSDAAEPVVPTNLIFMEPLLPDGPPVSRPRKHPASSSGGNGSLSNIIDVPGDISTPNGSAGGSAVIQDVQVAANSSTKKRSKGKTKAAKAVAEPPIVVAPAVQPDVPPTANGSELTAWRRTALVRLLHIPTAPRRCTRGPYTPSPMYQPPPFAPYPQAYAYPAQAYAQPYPVQSYPPPPAPAPPMYSTFVARAEYSSPPPPAQSSPVPVPTPTYAAPDQASSYSTFSARTGEPYRRGANTPGAAKRKRVSDPAGEDGANKRLEGGVVENGSSSVIPPPVIAAEYGTFGAQVDANPVAAAGPEGQGGTSDPAPHTNVCSNKTCHRTLPAHTAGAMCERCKERLRKRQIKAKQRFKLEPKKLLGRTGSGLANGSVEHGYEDEGNA
ncbi:hypothetical protein A0H81_02394 [Grifola frondosa]|uniref:Uncharacterized protein n=1 Tax=Grifola frondosa TaxID=5627 RepID=A0A1C7MNH3_GRIFR|nr:hypothetical protein A0H81_02394 [Grifola frondosa]